MPAPTACSASSSITTWRKAFCPKTSTRPSAGGSGARRGLTNATPRGPKVNRPNAAARSKMPSTPSVENMLMADNVVPLQQRPTTKREIEVSLRPATPCEIDVFIAALQSWIKKSPAIEDPKAFWQAMREEVAKYPIDVLMESAKQARGLRGFSWTPSIKEMVELCERLMEPRRAELRAIHRAESDRRAREQEAVERAAEAEREAKRQREREAYRQA